MRKVLQNNFLINLALVYFFDRVAMPIYYDGDNNAYTIATKRMTEILMLLSDC